MEKNIDEIIKEIAEGNLNRHDELYDKLYNNEWNISVSDVIQKFGNAKNNKCVLYAIGKLYEKQLNRAEAIKFFEKAIEQNFGPACTSLGRIYHWGHGAEENHQKAHDLFKLAIDNGDMEAYVHMATLHRNGQYVKQDYKKALEFYKSAITSGKEKIIDQVADECHIILRYKPGFSEFFELLKLCAEQGNAVAQCNLAECYMEGHGTKQDRKTGIKYMCQSRKNGCNVLELTEILEESANIYLLMDMYNEQQAYITELEFRPGGIKYEEAKREFDNCLQQKIEK